MKSVCRDHCGLSSVLSPSRDLTSSSCIAAVCPSRQPRVQFTVHQNVEIIQEAQLSQMVSIGYNSVWSRICECNEHKPLQTVFQHTYFMTYVLGLQVGRTVTLGKCWQHSADGWFFQRDLHPDCSFCTELNQLTHYVLTRPVPCCLLMSVRFRLYSATA